MPLPSHCILHKAGTDNMVNQQHLQADTSTYILPEIKNANRAYAAGLLCNAVHAS
jgi:hypothetical protein